LFQVFTACNFMSILYTLLIRQIPTSCSYNIQIGVFLLNHDFSRLLSLLRKEKGISQRSAAASLQVSQALLSHYENGIREPGLDFVVRACDYYNVSADFLLGRTMSRDGTMIAPDELFDSSNDKGNQLRGSVMATLQKKLLVNSVSVIFDLLGKNGNRDAILAAASYLGTALYKLFRSLARSSDTANENMFSVPPVTYVHGGPNCDMIRSELQYITALEGQKNEKSPFPDLRDETLRQEYPVTYMSLLQVIHATGERINQEFGIQDKTR